MEIRPNNVTWKDALRYGENFLAPLELITDAGVYTRRIIKYDHKIYLLEMLCGKMLHFIHIEDTIFRIEFRY